MKFSQRALRLFSSGLLLALTHPAAALEYRSTGRATLLYDAPSTAGGKVAVAGSGLPLEVVIDSGAWVKVRDHTGRLAWIEKSALGGVKSVMITAESSAIRQQPRGDAEVVFRAARGVLLDLAGESSAAGWMRVKHADGLAGWLPAHEAWGR